MMALSLAPGGALIATCTHMPPLKFAHKKHPPSFFFNSNGNPKSEPNLLSRRQQQPLSLTLAQAEGGVDPTSTSTTSAATKQSRSSYNPSPSPPPVFVGQEDVPLEGVVQFEKPSFYSRIDKWGRVALLAGGDVLVLLLFSAIGRFGHGFPVFDIETLRTADPFVAGWILGAYFLGGYAEDGRGMNGQSKAIIAGAKSWALGIPLGLVIRAVMSGHMPALPFILVTMGSTSILLIGWRALSSFILRNYDTKKSGDYRRGNPLELFELLTSLVRRW